MAMKVAIVGVGYVGATLAYTLLELETLRELFLAGRNLQRLEGEAIDLRHAASFFAPRQTISFGPVADCHNADIVVLCLSHKQSSFDRTHLAIDNARLFAEVVPVLTRQNPECVFVVATNPVEALTQWTIELSGLPPHRVLGAGTVIDSCRFRDALSVHLRVHPDDVRAYVLGEHGKSQFIWLSGAAVGGVHLKAADIPPHVVESTRSSGTDIFQLKGNTCYAIAQALKLIVRCIAGNRLGTMPVSTQVDLGEGFPPLCLAKPCIVGRRGIEQVLEPQFSSEEQQMWLASGRHVAATLADIHNALGDTPRAG
ncbi:malate dehydrogenase [Aeoliella sp.]|uniref:malate dehydrogenase n=1 Tax=Aeoliella sp. TaxID=2795800 RepID=UPI003CCBB058